MVSVNVLCVEILLDVIGLITGIIVLTRSSGSNLQRIWGCLAIGLSSLLLYDNLEWIYLFSKDVDNLPRFTDLPMNHLSMWHTVRTVVFLQFFSLFPIASLKPGWLTTARVINLSIPTILIICIACCYQLFNGHYTSLESFDDIRKNIGKQDVIVRLTLFIISVVSPSCNFMFPFLKRWIHIRRKQGPAMLFYMISYGLITSGYIWLMIGTTSLSFNVFGYLVIVPAIYMNIMHLLNDSPLSLPPSPDDKLKIEELEAIKNIEVSPSVLEIEAKLQTLMKEKAPFTNPQYSLKNLLSDLDTNENRLTKTFRYNGFTGFRDFINYNRLQYFKEEAMQHKDLTVKELMFKSGFTSRSSFYRYFASIEKISPSEYMENLNKAE